MKVRILSGNARGQVVEMPQTEAEVNISTGFAEAVEDATVEVEPEPEPEPEPLDTAPKQRAPRKIATE